MGKASQDKGKRFERWVAKWMARIFPNARRSANQAGGAYDPDVKNTPFWIETKHDNRISAWALMRQAKRDTDGRPIIGVLKHDYKDPLVLMELELLEELLIRWKIVEMLNDND